MNKYTFFLGFSIFARTMIASELSHFKRDFYAQVQAFRALKRAGYPIKSAYELDASGDTKSGAHCYQVRLPYESQQYQVMCYGPRCYVKPHGYDQDKIFTIMQGGCVVYFLDTDQTWWKKHFHYLSTNDESNTIHVPAGVIYTLVSGKYGLCMHTLHDDSTRSVEWRPEAGRPF